MEQLLAGRGLVIVLAVFGAWIVISTTAFGYSSTFTSNLAEKTLRVLDNGASLSEEFRIYNCEDPYRRPGYLYVNQSDDRQTRWIPYTKDFFDARSLDQATHPAPAGFDLQFDAEYIEAEFLNLPSTPRSWMNDVVVENARRRESIALEYLARNDSQYFLQEKGGGSLGWLWGRSLLIAGDSVDRFMIQSFCDELEGAWTQEWHVSGVCQVPAFNMTLVHWHIISMLNYKPAWFEEQKMPTAFEDRWEQLWARSRDTHLRGLNGKSPDLILWQSGLWDQTKFLFDLAKARYGSLTDDETVYHDRSDPQAIFRTAKRQAVWEEIRFLSTRLQKLVSYLHDEFGRETPMMYRSLTYHVGGMSKYDYILMELNRLGRAIAENAGHEIFEWGRIMNGFGSMYMDDQHVAKGPGSWLWSNMLLEYMARSASIGDDQRTPYFNSWEACHRSLISWGGA